MINSSAIEGFIQERGFDNFKWIDPKEIVVAQWVRMKCQFGCPGYGHGACPPNTPSVSDCMEFFRDYSHAVVIRLNKVMDKDDKDKEWLKQNSENLRELERQLFLDGYYKVFLLNPTGCSSCSECTNKRVDCIDKKNARPSPEAFAVDVYQTVRKLGMEINVVKESQSEVNRYAVLLIE